MKKGFYFETAGKNHKTYPLRRKHNTNPAEKILSTIFFLLFFIFHLISAVYVAENKPVIFQNNDGDDYSALAIYFAKHGTLAIERQRWFEPPRRVVIPEAYRPLLLPAAGGMFIFSDRHKFAQLAAFQAFLATLLASVIFMLGKRLGGELCAWLSLLIYSVHPLFNLYSLHFCTEILFSLLLGLFALLWLWRSKNIFKYCLLGICGGLAVFARPTALALLPLSIPALYATIHDKSTRFKAITLFAVSFMLLVMTGGFRNYYHFGEFKMTSFFGSYNFFLGNCNENLAAYKSSNGKDFLKHQDDAWNRSLKIAREMPAEYSANPALQDKYWQKIAWSDIQAMGVQNFLYLVTAKAWHFIRPWPLYGAHPKLYFWLLTLFEISLYAAGVYGIWKTRHNWMLLCPFIVIFLAGLTVHAVVHVMLRHRVPFVDIPLIIFSGYGLSCMISKMQQHKEKSST